MQKPRAFLILFWQFWLALSGGLSWFALSGELGASEVDLTAVSQSPRSRIVPGGFLVLRARVANRGSDDFQGNLVLKWPDRPQFEILQAVEIRNGTERILESLVNIPSDSSGKTIELEVSLRDGQGRITTRADRRPNSQRLQLFLEKRADPMAVGTALVEALPSYPPWYWPPPPSSEEEGHEFVFATQIDAGNSRRSLGFEDSGLPYTQRRWEPLDLVVISDPLYLSNAASMTAAKRYIEGGGAIWILLDAIPCHLLSSLLEPDQICESLDEVELYDFVVDVDDGVSNFQSADRRVQSTTKVCMKRVVQHGGNVTHSVDGWPAAIRFPIGQGELLVTTLSGYGWLQPRRNAPQDAYYQSNYELKPWGKQFAADLGGLRKPENPLAAKLQYPTRLLGVPVLPKRWVSSLLSAYCGMLVLAAVWFATRGKISQLAYAAPVIGLVLAAGILSLRLLSNQNAPESIGRLRFIEIAENGSSARILEQVAVSLKQVNSLTFHCKGDGGAQPNSTVTSGVAQLRTEDFHEWSYANSRWPSGVSRFEADYFVQTEEMYALGSLSERGLEVQLPAGVTSFEDALIQYTPGNAMPLDNQRQVLVASADTNVGHDRWIVAAILSDEQRRRLEVYNQLLSAEQEGSSLEHRVFGWAPCWDRLVCDRSLEEVGSALLSLPVRLQRPAAGQSLRIPHGLIRLQQSDNQPGSSPAFNQATGKWQQEQTQAMDRSFTFHLPEEVIPFRPDRITLNFSIEASGRKVSVFVSTKDSELKLTTLESPTLPWSTELTDPLVLQSMEDGTLDVRLQVSESTSDPSTSRVAMWKVDYLRLTAQGEATSP